MSDSPEVSDGVGEMPVDPRLFMIKVFRGRLPDPLGAALHDVLVTAVAGTPSPIMGNEPTPSFLADLPIAPNLLYSNTCTNNTPVCHLPPIPSRSRALGP
jgi:hypothetical protein